MNESVRLFSPIYIKTGAPNDRMFPNTPEFSQMLFSEACSVNLEISVCVRIR